MHVPGANTGRVEQLYREHGAALVLFAAAIAGERSWAQDAVHQVFLRLIEDEKLSRAIDVKAYLFACVRNAVLNEAKVRQRNIELDPESAWFNPPDQNRATELELQRALRALPDEQRQVTVLHIWGGLTFSQIADILKIRPNTVASRYRYALVRLREIMCANEDSCVNS